MTADDAKQRRIVSIMHSHSGRIVEYQGEAIVAVTKKGIVIAHTTISHTLYPWHRVTSFYYLLADEEAVRAIEGY